MVPRKRGASPETGAVLGGQEGGGTPPARSVDTALPQIKFLVSVTLSLKI